MMHRIQFGLAVCAAGLWLMAGCATSRQGADAGEKSQSEQEKLAAAHAHYAQGMIYEMDEQPDKALEEFSEAAERDPANEALVLELAQRYFSVQQTEKAVKLLEKAAAVPGASGAVFAKLGEGYSRLDKFTPALNASKEAIKRDPAALAGYRDLFIVNLQKEKPADALKALDEAAKAPNPDAEFLADLAGLYGTLSQQDTPVKAAAMANGIAVLKRAEDKGLDSAPRVAIKVADGYDQLGDVTNAVRMYETLLKQFVDLPTLRDSIHGKLAEIYLRTGNAKKASDELQAVLQDNPDNPQTYYFLGTVALEAQQWPQAAAYLQKTIQFNPDFEQAYYDLSTAQSLMGATNDALATLRRATVRFSTNFQSEFYTARVYARAKDFSNAVAHFSSAEALAQNGTNRLNGYFYFEAGAANERKGDFEQAAHYFEKSLKVAPDMPEALNYYGYMLADRGVKLERAREMIEKAVRQDPQNAAYIDSLGWVLFKLGKAQDGLAQIQKAIQLSDKDPDATLYEHLGDIYAALKQPDKAREAWKKSVSLEANPEVQKKLDQFSPH